MKGQTVVKAVLGQIDEIAYRARRLPGVEFGLHRPLFGLDYGVLFLVAHDD